ncbi:MAG: ribonuclease Z [Prevotella sp.]|nr:ribonuclease Z [Prevotella sp.]
MQPFKVIVLGCGSALPTLRHGASSQVVEVRNKAFMIDCGEGTQVQLRKARVHFNKISTVFISHLHGDHCFGLIGMISSFGMLGRTAPLHIYAHSQLGPLLDMQLDMFCQKLEYDVIFHPIETSESKIIYEDSGVEVSTIPLDHRVDCCGFLIKEKPTLPHLRRDMMDFYGIPLCYRNNIKAGADWTDSEGNVIPNSRLTQPADAPRSYAYCSDTRYMPGLWKKLKGVDALYHEATYCDDNDKLAAKYHHSTASEAAMTARDAGVGKLIIGHYSARYQDESVFLKEAREVFPDTYLADEMMVFNV